MCTVHTLCEYYNNHDNSNNNTWIISIVLSLYLESTARIHSVHAGAAQTAPLDQANRPEP